MTKNSMINEPSFVNRGEVIDSVTNAFIKRKKGDGKVILLFLEIINFPQFFKNIQTTHVHEIR